MQNILLRPRASVLRYGNWSSVVRLEGIQRRVTKIIKRVKDYSYRERFEKFGLITSLERNMRADLIETVKIDNGISNYGRYFFNISPQTENLLRQISKTKLQINWIFLLIVINL